jgi:hypothetical protein
MFGEPWDTLLLAVFIVAGILLGAFVQDGLSERAADRRRKADAASHSAE